MYLTTNDIIKKGKYRTKKGTVFAFYFTDNDHIKPIIIYVIFAYAQICFVPFLCFLK